MASWARTGRKGCGRWSRRTARRPVPAFAGLPWWGRRLDEEAAFQNGLENLEKCFAAAVEAVAKTFLGLAEDVVQIGPDKGIVSATENGEEEAVFASANEDGTFFGKIEGGAHFVLLALESADEHSEGGLNAAG